MLGPEVTEGPEGDPLGSRNTQLIEKLLSFDAVVVAGQAKSHCVTWTIDDLLEEQELGNRLAERTYLLEDCTSSVVVPGVVDYTDEADAAFERRPLDRAAQQLARSRARRPLTNRPRARITRWGWDFTG